MTIIELLLVLRRRTFSTLLTFVLALAAVAGAGSLQKPLYSSTEQLMLTVDSTIRTTTQLRLGYEAASERVRTYLNLVTVPQVVEQAIASSGVQVSGEALAASTLVANPLDTTLLNITVRNRSPEDAAALAKAVGAAFITYSRQLEQRDDPDGVGLYRMVETRAAAPSSHPVSPQWSLTIMMGLAVALVLALGQAVVRDRFDTSVRTARDLELAMGAAPLAVLVPPSRAWVWAVDEAQEEPFRSARSSIVLTRRREERRRLLVVSDVGGRENLYVAKGLGRAFAAAGERTIVIDANFAPGRPGEVVSGREARRRRRDGGGRAPGLRNVLRREVPVDAAITVDAGGVHLMSAGTALGADAALLASERLPELLGALDARFDVVIVAGDALERPETLILARLVDGYVVASVLGSSRADEMLSGVVSLTRAGGRLMGSVGLRGKVAAI